MAEKIYKVKIIPNSKINKIIEQTETFLKLKLTAPAKEGKANRALLDFLSEYFKIPKSQIKIIQGEKSREKKIKLQL